MNATQTPTIEEMRAFIDGSQSLSITINNKQEAYRWIEDILVSSGYLKRSKADKGTVREYLIQTTGYSRSQTTRLIGQYRRTGRILLNTSGSRGFPTIYTDDDVAALARIDEAHEDLSGPAAKHLCHRAFDRFGDPRYVRLKDISVSHLYNLRNRQSYRRLRTRYTRTKPTVVSIGERAKPTPDGQPGHIRVDTVHQGDKDGAKGVYHINLVDEVTQWEVVVAVEGISERYMVPALEMALEAFPFELVGFHADNGSEYINNTVAELLGNLQIKLTKSRPRHSGDNGLVETKNGAVIRKALGYGHIPQANAAIINRWYLDWFVPYLNFHRPCAFRVTEVDTDTGKRIHKYPSSGYRTPHEKLKEIKEVESYLRPDITLADLDKRAYAMSDTDWALSMDEAKGKMFKALKY